jgi:hypothetical protein
MSSNLVFMSLEEQARAAIAKQRQAEAEHEAKWDRVKEANRAAGREFVALARRYGAPVLRPHHQSQVLDAWTVVPAERDWDGSMRRDHLVVTETGRSYEVTGPGEGLVVAYERTYSQDYWNELLVRATMKLLGDE